MNTHDIKALVAAEMNKLSVHSVNIEGTTITVAVITDEDNIQIAKGVSDVIDPSKFSVEKGKEVAERNAWEQAATNLTVLIRYHITKLNKFNKLNKDNEAYIASSD